LFISIADCAQTKVRIKKEGDQNKKNTQICTTKMEKRNAIVVGFQSVIRFVLFDHCRGKETGGSIFGSPLSANFVYI